MAASTHEGSPARHSRVVPKIQTNGHGALPFVAIVPTYKQKPSSPSESVPKFGLSSPTWEIRRESFPGGCELCAISLRPIFLATSSKMGCFLVANSWNAGLIVNPSGDSDGSMKIEMGSHVASEIGQFSHFVRYFHPERNLRSRIFSTFILGISTWNWDDDDDDGNFSDFHPWNYSSIGPHFCE